MNPILSPKDVVFVIWTQWQHRTDVEAQSRAVVRGCWNFIRESLGDNPGVMFFLKTPAPGSDDDEIRRIEEHAYSTAMADLAAEHRSSGTDFEFRYIPVVLPVTSAWHVAWRLSEWWKKGEILGHLAMDFIEARLMSEELTQLDAIDPAIRPALLAAPQHFRKLLEKTAEHRGLTVGGYKTHELVRKENDLLRRGGLSAKDMIEAAFRCYASGALGEYEPLQDLLKIRPDLRMRSEILGMHRDCWNQLRASNRLKSEPWESTFQLILGALLEDVIVDQVDFEWLLEKHSKADKAVIEQLRRGLLLIERLRQEWFTTVERQH